MKNNLLRTALIRSAALLAVFSIVIYLTLSSPEGSIWSSMGAIFYTLFKAAQLTVGLVLALLVCFAVLAGIFFGCAAMVSREGAKRMYEQLRRFMSDKFNSLQSLIMTGNRWKPRGELSGSLHKSIDDMRRTQGTIEEKLRIMQARIEQIEQNESITKLSDWLRAEEKKRYEAQVLLEVLDRQVGELQKQTADMAEQLARMSGGDSLKDLTGRLETLEKNGNDFLSAMHSVTAQVDVLSRDAALLRESVPQGAGEEENPGQDDTDAHRLFSYIENPQEREKIQQLVAEALDREMTYAQAADHIAANVAPETAGIIAQHPSLTKKIISESRKKK
ncbi:MAG: hypothetical protein SCH71_05225 [Desulfobulbaceae bacterium]|nr:hypothetical protein [Desulfobulbaceae bacterium]